MLLRRLLFVEVSNLVLTENSSFVNIQLVDVSFGVSLFSLNLKTSVILNTSCFLLTVSLFVLEFDGHLLDAELVSGGITFDSSFFLLLKLEFSLKVTEETTRADSYIFDIDTFKPHAPSLKNRLEVGGNGLS